MDIEHIGPALVDQLVDHGLVHDVADIFALLNKREDLLKIERMAKKSVDRLLQAITAARATRDFSQLLTGLGIPLVGTVAARVIADKYRRLETILSTDQETMRAELAEIHGIGPKIAESVAGYFADPKTRAVLEKLLELGVEANTPDTTEQPVADGPLRGRSFCITGVLSQPRQAVQERIRAAGGEVHDRVKQDTNFLVAGDNVGKSKLEAAQKRGVRLLSEEELEAMLRDSKI